MLRITCILKGEKTAKKVADTFAPRPSGAVKNPAVQGITRFFYFWLTILGFRECIVQDLWIPGSCRCPGRRTAVIQYPVSIRRAINRETTRVSQEDLQS